MQGLYINKFGVYPIYLREQMSCPSSNQLYSYITRTHGGSIEVIDDHPSYQQYGDTFTTQFNGFLEEGKPLTTETTKLSDTLVIKSVFANRKHKSKYLGKIVYCCNMSYHLENLPPAEIDRLIANK